MRKALAPLAVLALLTGAAARASAYTCGTTVTVLQAGGGTCTDIQSCVDGIPASLSDNYCIDIQDSATYNGFVVQGKASNGFQIIIGPLNQSNRPNVVPPGPGAIALELRNSSVTVHDLMSVGSSELLLAASSFAYVDNVYLEGSGAAASGDAVADLQGAATMTRSSVTVAASGPFSYAALKLSGSNNMVAMSTFTGSGTEVTHLVEFNAGAANRITQSVLQNATCKALAFRNGSSNGLISFSTMTGVGASCPAVHFGAGASNAVSSSYIFNGSGPAVLIDTIDGANSGASISSSTVTGHNSGAAAIEVNSGASGGQFDQLFVLNNAGASINLGAASGFVVDRSTMIANTAATALGALTVTSSGHAVHRSYFANPLGLALLLDSGANNVTVDLSTASGGTPSTPAARIAGTDGVAVSSSLFVNSQGDALEINGAINGTIARSTMTSNSASGAALTLTNSAANNTVWSSYAYNPPGDAVYLKGGANSNLISATTMYSNVAATYAALHIEGAGSNTIDRSLMLAPIGSPVLIYAGSDANTIQKSTAITQAAAASALVVSGANNTQILQSYLAKTGAAAGGTGAFIVNGASFTTISQTTMVVTGANGSALYAGSPDLTIDQSVMIATAGVGASILMNSVSLTNSLIQGATGVAVSGGSNSTLSNDVIMSSGTGTTALLIQTGAIMVQVANSTITAVGKASSAVLMTTAGPLDAQGPLVVRGDFNTPAGVFQSGPYSHVFGGNLNWGGASFQIGQSTIVLNGLGNTPPLPRQVVTVPPGVAFGGLRVMVSSVVFLGTGFNASSFDDRVVGSTVAFLGGAANPYNFGSFTAVGAPGPGLINLISTLPGSSYGFSVQKSSISFARIEDAGATPPTIHANDGTSVPGPGNSGNVNFLPFLSIGLLGQSYTETVGWTGGITPATAGSYTATVRAVSAGSNTVTTAAFPVQLNPGDPNEPAYTQTLVLGATTFALKVPTAGNHVFVSSGGPVFGIGQANVNVNPGAFSRLQLLLPGESPNPGTVTGKTGVPNGQIINQPFSLTVRSVDTLFNPVIGITDQVRINSTGGNFPQTQQLLAGTTTFPNVVYTSSSPTRQIIASDLTNGAIINSTSPTFGSFAPTSSSPTVAIDYAPNSIQSSLGGAVSGTAQDPAGVTSAQAAIRNVGTGLWFDWSGSFNLVSPSFATANLSNPGGANTAWSVPLSDAMLANNATYYVVAKAFNASGNVIIGETTFTFRTGGLVAGNSGDGQGSATATPSLGTQTCQILVASITVTAGSSGIQPGGAIALRLPDNWQRPNAEDAGNVTPLNPGNVHIISTTTYSLDFNPQNRGGAPLGDNWLVYNANSLVTPGQPISFVYKGFPGSGPLSVGPQVFSVMTQGSGSGNLKPIATQPSFSLNAGPASQLQFSPIEPLTVGNLQTSPTMQLLVTDNCGNSTNTVSAVQVSLSAGQFGQPDLTSTFYNANGSLIGAPGSKIAIPLNNAVSGGFYYVTGMGNGFQNLFATATFTASQGFAGRFVRVLGSSVSLTGVSIDSGTAVAGQLATTIAGGSFQGAAFINFTLSDPALRWEVIVSTSNTTFYPELVHRFGAGSPGRTLSWPGVVETSYPQRFLPPGGPYYVKIKVEGGVVENTALSVSIAQSASIYGTVNSTGAFAYVQANGPGASYGNFAVASSTGYFQIFGLKAGARYNITATTGTVSNGQFLRLTSSSNNVTAAAGGTNVGAMPFPTPSYLRVRVQIPNPSPYDFWGGVNAHTQDYSNNAFGTLHYAAGTDKSDDGQQVFGANASTWTVLGVLPGTYDVDLNLQQVGISSTVRNVTVSAGATTDLAVQLPRKSNVFGYVTIPSTTPFGTFVGVQGTKAGDLRPTMFGGAYIDGTNNGVYVTSGVYSLYGLDPGSWTIRATAFGFASATRSLFISSSSDVGNQLTGGFDLAVSSGGRLTGTINLVGDSTNLPSLNNAQGSGLDLFINAYSPTSFTNAGVQVHLSTSSTLSSSTFTITGLDDGTYFINTWLQGAAPVQVSAPVTGGSGNAVINVQVNSAKAFLTVKLPGASLPPSEFRKVSLFQSGQGGPHLAQDLVQGSTIQYFASSATWQSPALGAGYYTFQAFYGKTGMYKTISLPLTNGATAFATLDLSGSTYTVSGTVALAADVSIANAANVVSVSSIPALLANSAYVNYCVMGQAVSTSAFHLELLPIDQYRGTYLNGDLQQMAPATCVSNPPVSNNVGGNDANPFLAYVAEISTTGAFSFSVPPGTYLLRNPTDVNGDRTTEELPPVRQIVTVSSDTTGLTFRLEKGVSVSGRLSLPPGVTATRPFLVSMLDSTGNVLKSQNLNINNGNSTTYSFDRVPDGTYAIKVDDFGFPRVYGARPVVVKVAGVSLSGQDLALVQTGIIKGKLAIMQTLPGSTTRQFLVIGANNFNLLPKSFQIRAESNPWFQGGLFYAQNDNCAAATAGAGNSCFGFTLDANDQFVIGGVLPGTYDVRYESYSDPNDNSSINLVRSMSPGITVSEQRTTDIGTVNLVSAIQVRGTVTDSSTGLAISNVSMRAKPSVAGNSNHDNPNVTTDKTGKYTLVGLDPNVKLYDIYAAYRGDHQDSTDIPPYELKIKTGVDITTTSVVDFALTPAAFAVGGRIVGTAGGPPLFQPFGGNDNADIKKPGAVVFLQKTTELPHDNPIADIMVPTNADGTFTIPALTAATYKMTVASLGYSSLQRTIIISTASIDVGTLTLGRGADLSGTVRKPDGTSPSPREVDFIAAVTADLGELLAATLVKDKNTGTVTGYSVSGFRPGVNYRLIIGNDGDSFGTPEEAKNIVFSTTTESRTLDLVVRPSKPFAFAKVRKSGPNFVLSFELSQPLRQKTAADDDVSAILSTFSARGTLNSIELSPNRSLITAQYAPNVAESSFTLRLNGYSTLIDPDSLDPVNQEFVYLSTFTFFTGVDGFLKSNISNVNGGTLLVEGNNGKVAIPSGAFQVDASSSVEITLQVSQETLSGAATNGYKGAAANLAALRTSGSAYPTEMLKAMAATPPNVSPFSGFYDVLLPLGVRTALQKPVKMTVEYSTGTDPTTLNLYWYNAAANAYVLQQDVTGAPRVIDTLNHTITINVNHFSTFVLFNSGVNVISGNSFPGSEIEAYNFPNPFDLTVKTVTSTHGAGAQTVRGTMIRFAVPTDVSGDASIKIFNVAGERVRSIDLGGITGGNYYYQAWDGRNDAGRDVASGVYIGQVKIGSKSKFFKMALIK